MKLSQEARDAGVKWLMATGPKNKAEARQMERRFVDCVLQIKKRASIAPLTYP